MILLIQLSNRVGCQLFVNGDSALNHLVDLWIIIMIATALVCFLVGELTRNYSQVDKVWSLMPIVYSCVTLAAYHLSPRILLMTLLVTIWGIRLSYNFYRKGGYNIIPWKGEEDYRWGVVRQNPMLRKPWSKTLFNLLFISFYQHVVIFLFSTPLLFAAKYSEIRLTELDYLAAFFMFLFIMIETVADNQLHMFHLQKSLKTSLKGIYADSLSNGFLSEGLWNYVRHPNYTAEQAIWISFYFFGASASGQIINWTLVGPVLLVLLFIGSTELTERISMYKYPGYENYKRQVPKFIPLIFKSLKEGKLL